MGFFKKIFGFEGSLPPPNQGRTVCPPSANTSEIARLVERASAYYPDKAPAKALPIFMEAIRIAPSADNDADSQVELDTSDIGFAIWAAWVCLDLLDHPESETDALLAEARVKSPVTARRIEERIAEYREKEAAEKQTYEVLDILSSPSKHQSADLQNAAYALSAIARRDGAWWALRDAAIHLAKAGLGNMSWPLFNEALLVAQSKQGNLPSIYMAMGDLCKAENRHADAARQYLLSIAAAPNDPLKRAVEQLRISLKKAGANGDPISIRDALMADVGKVGTKQLIGRLNVYLKPSVSGGSETKDP